jgi:hypothetical protein
MANETNSNDLSDIRTSAGIEPSQTGTQLPIRGEKRIIPSPVSPSDLNTAFEIEWLKTGQKIPVYKANTGRTSLVQEQDFHAVTALSPFVDYVIVRMKHRGIDASGNATQSLDGVYRFLINPSQMQVSRTTLDEQSMTRAGWQIGVWGEDSVQINLSGKTAGQYWSFGLTDAYQPYAESYRNLVQLQTVFENNGYWFEGEQLNEGPLAADFLRRRIKMHSDVELIVGNFIWFGMFDTLTISQSAEEPFLMTFNISFVAWKERFRSTSPYQNQLTTQIERGHSYGAWQSTSQTSQDGIPANSSQPMPLPPSIPQPALPLLPFPFASPPPPPPPPLPASTPIVSSAQQSAANNPTIAQTTDTMAQDYSPSPRISTFNSTVTGP